MLSYAEKLKTKSKESGKEPETLGLNLDAQPA